MLFLYSYNFLFCSFVLKTNYTTNMIRKIEEFIQNNKTQTWLIAGLLLLVTAAIFSLNLYYPTFCDDWVYSYVFGQDEIRRIENIGDLITSQYTHYMAWGGRIVAHTIAQLLLSLPTIYQDILNTIIFVLFIYLMYSISNQRKEKSFILLLTTIGLFWIYTDQMLFESAIWITGSANYLWTSFIILLFLYFYIDLYLFDNKNRNKVQNGSIIFLGLLAGWCNENSSLAAIFAVTAILILLKIEKREMPAWSIYGLILCISGYILLFAAPGNFIRLEIAQQDASQTPGSFSLELIASRINSIITSLKVAHSFLLIVTNIFLFAIFIILNKSNKHDLSKKRVSLIVILLSLTGVISACIMMAVPSLALRSIFFTNSLLVISSTILIRHLIDKNKFIYFCTLCLSLGLFGITIFDYSKKHNTMFHTSELWKEREAWIESEKRKGHLNIILNETFDIHPKYFIYEINKDSTDMYNKYYSKFLGIESIRVAVDAKQIDTP